MADEKLTPAEASRRIVVGMGLVYDLYNELVGFLRLIRASLEDQDLDASYLMGSRFSLPLGPRKSRTEADKYLSVDLGMVFELGTADNEEAEADIEDDEHEEEREKKGVKISAESQFLAIRVLLYDHDSPTPDSFQPQVCAAVLDKVSRKGKKKSGAAAQQFTVHRNQFLHLVKGLNSSISKGNSLSCRITGGQMSAVVSGIVTRPLTEFTSEAAVQAFVDQVTALVAE
jgi:hypothetical protein